MVKHKKLSAFFMAIAMISGVSAADIYVTAKGGKNKNPGTKEAPLKNIWKAVEKAAPGDVIHVAEGSYAGKMSCGWIEINKPVSLVGGYSKDFSVRDPLTYKTMLRPTNKQNMTKPIFGTLTINTRNSAAESHMVIDGFIFDHTDANNYHASKGKPDGFADGMLTLPPAKGKSPNPSIDRALVHARSNGTLAIQNCLFLNGSNYALNIQHFSGKVSIVNNVFVGNRMAAAEIASTNAKAFAVECDFSFNTVLFTWTRTHEFTDMGYGVRTNRNVVYNISRNVLGLNCMAGFDNTKGNPREKQISLDQNIFFLNKKADVAITVSPNIHLLKVEDDGFEDIADYDGMESLEENIALNDPAVLKDIIDMNYLQAFLNATYSEKVDYDENSPVNQFRAAFGLNKQGTISSKASMFANPYPFNMAIKLFGAVDSYGAQKIQ